MFHRTSLLFVFGFVAVAPRLDDFRRLFAPTFEYRYSAAAGLTFSVRSR